MTAARSFPDASPRAGWAQRHRNLLTALLLMLAAWALYLPSVRYGFVYFDDVRILRDHPELYGQSSLAGDVHAIFVTSFPREEPLLLRDLTWALDGRVYGFGNTFGYHLGNVLLHGVVVTLMFAFLLGTTRRYGFALVTTVAWLALAIHTEPVVWIMGRKDILSALFMLLALCAQTRRLAAKEIVAQGGWYAVTSICFVLGLFSKISVLTFPLVLFLHAVFLPYLNGERPANGSFSWGRGLMKEVLLLGPGMVVAVLVYDWYGRTLAQMGIFDRGYTAHGLAHLWNLLMIDPLVFWVYLRQIFWPGHLAVIYEWPELLKVYPPRQMVAALATVATIGAVGIRLFRRHKDLFFYYAAFFVLMVPYLNLTYIGIWVADRYAYFSAFCVLAIAVTCALAVLRRPNPGLRIAVLAVGVAFGAVNLYQKLAYEPAWRDGETLWRYHLTLPRPSVPVYANLASYYYFEAVEQAGRPGMAQSLRKMSVVVDAGLEQFWPDHQQSPPANAYFLFFLRSLVQEVNGEPVAALQSLLICDQLNRKFDSTQLNLARLYRKLAETATDPQQRQTYATAARERFEKYIALAFRGRPAPAAVQQELADIEAGEKAAQIK